MIGEFILSANAKLCDPDQAHNSDGVWIEVKDGRNRRRVAARGSLQRLVSLYLVNRIFV